MARSTWTEEEAERSFKNLVTYRWNWEVQFTNQGASVFLQEIDGTDSEKIQLLKMDKITIQQELKHMTTIRNARHQVNYEGFLAERINALEAKTRNALITQARITKKKPVGLISAGEANPAYKKDIMQIADDRLWMAVFKRTISDPDYWCSFQV